MASVMGMITLASANTENELMVQYIDEKPRLPSRECYTQGGASTTNIK